MDIYGKALKDYQSGVEDQSLILNTSYGEAEEMPVWYFFRGYEEMPEMEQMALSIADGDILDIGAGAGCHALVLQQMNKEVTAIDTSEVAVEIMQNDGLKRAVKADFFEYQGGQYDTMIMLMNGIGLVGTLDGFRQFLNHAKKLLKPEGQLIFDTSDIKYLYEGKALPKDKYYGEVSFQYEYQGIKGEWFDWIYIDENTLEDVAEECGWFVYYLHKDENDQYLVRMIPKIED
ncbi:MAG: SAM-dependent methyltransferase [Roseivirga sp.]|jgi:SAM-dependent methyltransferase